MRPDVIRAVTGFIKRLVLAEAVAGAVYILAASLGYYAKLYRDLKLTGVLSFQVAHTIFLFGAQAAIVLAVYVWWRRTLAPELRPYDLVVEPEHERLERKSTLRWDLMAGKVNKSMERATLKTVAAFLNGKGGQLVIGIADDGSVVGLEHDYATLAHQNADGLANHFGNLFNAMLGASARHLVRLQAFTHQQKECMLVSVGPSARPVYLRDENREEFFIRTGNATTSLKLSEAQVYIDSHWKRKK